MCSQQLNKTIGEKSHKMIKRRFVKTLSSSCTLHTAHTVYSCNNFYIHIWTICGNHWAWTKCGGKGTNDNRIRFEIYSYITSKLIINKQIPYAIRGFEIQFRSCGLITCHHNTKICNYFVKNLWSVWLEIGVLETVAFHAEFWIESLSATKVF